MGGWVSPGSVFSVGMGARTTCKGLVSIRWPARYPSHLPATLLLPYNTSKATRMGFSALESP